MYTQRAGGEEQRGEEGGGQKNPKDHTSRGSGGPDAPHPGAPLFVRPPLSSDDAAEPRGARGRGSKRGATPGPRGSGSLAVRAATLSARPAPSRTPSGAQITPCGRGCGAGARGGRWGRGRRRPAGSTLVTRPGPPRSCQRAAAAGIGVSGGGRGVGAVSQRPVHTRLTTVPATRPGGRVKRP